MIIFLRGTEPFLAATTINQLKEKYLSKNPDGVELINIEADQSLINWADLQASPLFSQTRLIIIRHASSLTAEQQRELASYLRALPPTSIVAIWEGAKPFQKKSPLSELFNELPVKLIDVSLPQGSAMRSYLRRRAKYHNLNLSPKDEQDLISHYGKDLWALDNQLAVLSLGGKITEGSEDLEPFALYRAVYQGQWSRVPQLIASQYSVGVVPELIIGSIASALRKKGAATESVRVNLLSDIDIGIKSGVLDQKSAMALLSYHLPITSKKRVEWKELWEENLGG